jgi:hypothetical protein
VLRSTAPIAGLLPIEPQPHDLEILFGAPAEVGRILEYADGTRFAIRPDFGQISCNWTSESTPEDTATYLLGPVLAYLLRLRGTLSLHASAVAVDERAIVIAGHPGAGKSTTAAAFARSGATVITEDVAPVVWIDGAPSVTPGYPRIRLWEDVATTLFGELPPLTPTWPKRFLDVTEQFARHPYPIAKIVILGGRTANASLRRLTGHEAAIALLRNASMTHALDDSMREGELAQVTRLAEAVPLFAATAPDDLQRAGELLELLR